MLSSENFGDRIYKRFPPKYREDDVSQNYALQRYLKSLADGGFKHVVDDINMLPTLIDSDNVDAKLLPILFKQYGLDVFNGIPEIYLRYLLPRLGEAWSKKGSVSIIEFITSSLSGIKASTDIEYDEEDNPTVYARLEMDYNIGDYVPDPEQFVRLLENFVPFFCDLIVIYSYLFTETSTLSCKEVSSMIITETVEELCRIMKDHCDELVEQSIVEQILETCELSGMIVLEEKVTYSVVDESPNIDIMELLKQTVRMSIAEEKASIPMRGIANDDIAVVGIGVVGILELGNNGENADKFSDNFIKLTYI